MSQSELEKWNNKRKRKNNIRFAIGFLCMALFFYMVVRATREGIESLTPFGMFVFLVGFGILMIWLSIDQGFLQRDRCTTIIKAECVDIKYSKVGYHPRFSYEWNGESYVGDVQRYASKRKTKKRYVVGNEYEILINPNNPHEIRVDFKIGISNIFMLLMGIAMVALPIYIAFFEN